MNQNPGLGLTRGHASQTRAGAVLHRRAGPREKGKSSDRDGGMGGVSSKRLVCCQEQPSRSLPPPPGSQHLGRPPPLQPWKPGVRQVHSEQGFLWFRKKRTLKGPLAGSGGSMLLSPGVSNGNLPPVPRVGRNRRFALSRRRGLPAGPPARDTCAHRALPF